MRKRKGCKEKDIRCDQRKEGREGGRGRSLREKDMKGLEW